MLMTADLALMLRPTGTPGPSGAQRRFRGQPRGAGPAQPVGEKWGVWGSQASVGFGSDRGVGVAGGGWLSEDP